MYRLLRLFHYIASNGIIRDRAIEPLRWMEVGRSCWTLVPSSMTGPISQPGALDLSYSSLWPKIRSIMPVLRNTRHECFAQDIVRGAKLEDAHRAAGLSGNRKSAWKIRQRSDMIRRIKELLEQREQIEAKAARRLMVA
jgi:hypothetical protein